MLLYTEKKERNVWKEENEIIKRNTCILRNEERVASKKPEAVLTIKAANNNWTTQKL